MQWDIWRNTKGIKKSREEPLLILGPVGDEGPAARIFSNFG